MTRGPLTVCSKRYKTRDENHKNTKNI